jgi:hypothetical protein
MSFFGLLVNQHGRETFFHGVQTVDRKLPPTQFLYQFSSSVSSCADCLFPIPSTLKTCRYTRWRFFPIYTAIVNRETRRARPPKKVGFFSLPKFKLLSPSLLRFLLGKRPLTRSTNIELYKMQSILISSMQQKTLHLQCTY